MKGTSVLKYDPTGNAANAYRDLAKEVLNGAKAPACVRARLRSSSGRPRPLSNSRRSLGPEQEAEPTPVEPLEETVEHAPPFELVVDSGDLEPPREPKLEPEPESASRPDLRPVEELPRIESCPSPRRASTERPAPSRARTLRSSASSGSARG